MDAVVRPADQSLPRAALHLSGVSYGDGVLPFRDEVKRLRTVARAGVGVGHGAAGLKPEARAAAGPPRAPHQLTRR
jgi:hypothetical protein